MLTFKRQWREYKRRRTTANVVVAYHSQSYPWKRFYVIGRRHTMPVGKNLSLLRSFLW